MKIAAYEVREDERSYFQEFAALYHCELVMTEQVLTEDTLSLAQGCDGITILGQSHLTDALLDRVQALGIRGIATRTIGYNHIDIAHSKQIGLPVCNSNYGPGGVADYTVMLLLMCLRNYKQALFRLQVNDYSLTGLLGREMQNLTVGIIGTGRIGLAVLERLHGFGCHLLAYDPHPNDKGRTLAEYKSLDEIFSYCDVISLHVPLLPETRHLINENTISQCKDGVIIINCARGELISLPSAIKGIESRRIGALGLDVVENEEGIYHHDLRSSIIRNADMAYLRQFPNVIMTPHMAFYTDAATRDMVHCGVKNLLDIIHDEPCSTRII